MCVVVKQSDGSRAGCGTAHLALRRVHLVHLGLEVPGAIRVAALPHPPLPGHDDEDQVEQTKEGDQKRPPPETSRQNGASPSQSPVNIVSCEADRIKGAHKTGHNPKKIHDQLASYGRILRKKLTPRDMWQSTVPNWCALVSRKGKDVRSPRVPLPGALDKLGVTSHRGPTALGIPLHLACTHDYSAHLLPPPQSLDAAFLGLGPRHSRMARSVEQLFRRGPPALSLLQRPHFPRFCARPLSTVGIRRPCSIRRILIVRVLPS